MLLLERKSDNDQWIIELLAIFIGIIISSRLGCQVGY